VTSGDLARLADMAVLAEAAGADRIHLDVEDGVFTPAFTVSPAAAAAVRQATRLPLEVHLQTVEPERWIDVAARGGADLIIVHVEGTRFPLRAARMIRDAGARAGFAVLLATPIEAVLPIAAAVRQITLMSADPAPEAVFQASVLEKARALQGRVEAIEVDGGVTAAVLAAVAGAGVTTAVVGRALFADGFDRVAASVAALRAAEEGPR
jgi:ribulose-phosphate 3-epimerase